MEEEKEGYCFFPPPKRKTKKDKKLWTEKQALETADIVWDEEEISSGNEEEQLLPEKEDESLPL
ncbi:MAG: hypothetical protein ACPL7L_00700 [bacterium]